MNMKFPLALILVLLGGSARAQEMVEKTLSGSSTSANPAEARRQIQDETAQKLTEELARELLGDERFRKQQPVIQSKVLKSAGRFIPFSKPGPLSKAGDVYTMSVTMKANVSSLRQVLQEAGLLNENTTSPVILPMVTFIDRVNAKTDRWWLGEERAGSNFLRSVQKRFETALRKSFRAGGFHVVKPQGGAMGRALPRALRSESPGPADLQLISDWFGAPLILNGSVALLSPKDGRGGIEVKLEVFQTSNNRPIADLNRSFNIEAGGFEMTVEKKWNEVVDGLAQDLTSQVVDAWQKGSIGSSQMRLVMEPRPALQEIEALKEKLRSSSVGIRSVRERLISSQSLILEVESPVSSVELAQRLNGFEYAGRRFEASPNDEKSVRIKWGGAR